jgi:molybdate/tungstate transport system substrate-binding protein
MIPSFLPAQVRRVRFGRTLAASALVTFALVALALAAVMLLASPERARARGADPTPLIIFHADSLTAYMAALTRRFEAAHAGVVVQTESSGSLDAIRKITDLHLPCDILVAADWRLLAKPRPRIAPWVAIFAGNSMGLLYTPTSADAAEINAHNWYQVLTQPGVRYGHSNPERDPAGYWTLILWQLAERFYHAPGLAARLAADCPPANIRPHNVDLIALLQSGDLDYYFGYASDARLGGLRFLALPAEINLGDIKRRAEYAQAAVEIGSGAARHTIRGAPIAYGATLAANAPQRALALEFLELMLGAAGRQAAGQHGLSAYAQPYYLDPRGRMPAALRALARPLGAD